MAEVNRECIVVNRVSKEFKSAPKPALDSVSFSLKRGRIAAIIGPSGCGKTTLLRILAGLEAPTVGDVSVFGKTASETRIAGLTSMAFQDSALFPWRDVKGNIRLPLEVGKSNRARLDRVDGLISMIGLSGRENSLPKSLSGGMRQRVAFARSLVVSPEILLLDEPFSSVDEIFRCQLIEGFEELWSSSSDRATTLFVTHSVSDAVFLADEVFIMSEQPGTIREIMPIEFDRPRKECLLETQEFFKKCKELRNSLARVLEKKRSVVRV